MKHFSLLLFFVLSTAFSQDNVVYHFTKSTVINSYDLKANPQIVSKSIEIAQKEWRFVIDQEIASGYVIRFLKWNKNSPQNEKFYEAKTNKGERLYFYITTTQFNDNVEKYVNKNPRWSFVTGAITIPIKIRPGGDKKDTEGNLLRPFDFTGEVNVGLSIGLRIKMGSNNSKFFLIPSTGINLTAISVDESTVTNGFVTSKTNASSLTPFIGLICEYDSFQIALMTGWDNLSGRTGENWIYQGKPWFGIGLGYNIFNTSNNKPNND